MVASRYYIHTASLSSPFQLQITASVREQPLLATSVTKAAPTLPAAAVREPTLLFVTERGFILCSSAHCILEYQLTIIRHALVKMY